MSVSNEGRLNILGCDSEVAALRSKYTSSQNVRSIENASRSLFESVTTTKVLPISACRREKTNAFAAVEVKPLSDIRRAPRATSCLRRSNSAVVLIACTNTTSRRKRRRGGKRYQFSCGASYLLIFGPGLPC